MIFNDIKNDISKLREIGITIHNIIYNTFNINCYITIGYEMNDIREISKCFNKMELIMERKFYNKDTYVFSEEDDNENISNENDDKLLKLIKQNIEIKDIESLKKNFNLLCNKYSKKESMSQIYLKFIFSEILKELYNSLREISEDDFKNDIDKLYRSSDFSNL